MTYPYDKEEIQVFVPESLQSLDNPPTFHLRPGTSREKRHFKRMCLEEGLRNHSNEAIRTELLAGLKEFCTEAEYAEWEPRVKALWEAGDDFNQEHKATPIEDVPEFLHPDEDAVEKVLAPIKRDWRPLRVMGADNSEFNQMLPQLTRCIIVTKYENVDVPIRKDGKYLKLECGEAIIEWLNTFAEENSIEGSPAAELNIACLLNMNFTKAQEKKSVSPSPSPKDPQISKIGEESTDGKSKASASSEKTQEG